MIIFCGGTIYTQGPNLDHTFLIPDFYLVHYPKQSLAIIADWDEDLVPEQYIIVLCQTYPVKMGTGIEFVQG